MGGDMLFAGGLPPAADFNAAILVLFVVLFFFQKHRIQRLVW